MNNLFKIRASASGKLLVNPLNKNETLSQTTKTYLKEWAIEKIYNVKKEINSKYLNKGILLEDLAIDKLIGHLDLNFAIKNEQFFEDDFFCGTPDLIINDIVYDVKCSWDCFTFPLFDTEIKNKDYYSQLQVYMHLTGCKKAVLCYVLLNTPQELEYQNAFNYDNVEEKYTIKTFEIEYDNGIIEQLKTRVQQSREYLQTILNN